jgi:hypothetical protein
MKRAWRRKRHIFSILREGIVEESSHRQKIKFDLRDNREAVANGSRLWIVRLCVCAKCRATGLKRPVDAEAKVQLLAHPEGTVRYAETDFPDPFSPAKKQIREVRENVSKLRITGTQKG